VRERTGPVSLAYLASLVTLVLAVAVACTPTTAGRPGSATSAPPQPPGEHASHITVPTVVAASPAQERAQFEQLLGQHALLAARLMRGLVSGPPGLQEAATASLQANTDTLSKLVGSAYGSAEGDRFKQLWQRHITELSAYAGGTASKDESARQAARADLMTSCDAYGAWLAGASKGRVQAADAVSDVRSHVHHLLEQVDAYAARDHDQAYRIEREAYRHMYTTGVTLAKGSVAPKDAAGLDAPTVKLRSAFAMLLGEHMELIVDAQRATFAGSPEFKAAGAQVNANTTALTQALGGIVGPRKAAEFQSAWGDHVEGLIGYTTAVASGDAAAKATAEKELNRYAIALALYFSGVVRDQRAFVPLTGAITAHDRHLVEQVDAYAAKNYAKAHIVELEGYQQMLGVANTLVDAIQRSVKPGLPVGGSQTGGGGTAQRPR